MSASFLPTAHWLNHHFFWWLLQQSLWECSCWHWILPLRPMGFLPMWRGATTVLLMWYCTTHTIILCLCPLLPSHSHWVTRCNYPSDKYIHESTLTDSNLTESNGCNPVKKVTFLPNEREVLLELRKFTYKMEEDMVRSREVSMSEEGREKFGAGF